MNLQTLNPNPKFSCNKIGKVYELSHRKWQNTIFKSAGFLHVYNVLCEREGKNTKKFGQKKRNPKPVVKKIIWDLLKQLSNMRSI